MPVSFDNLPNELFQLVLHSVFDYYDSVFVKSPASGLRLVNKRFEANLFRCIIHRLRHQSRHLIASPSYLRTLCPRLLWMKAMAGDAGGSELVQAMIDTSDYLVQITADQDTDPQAQKGRYLEALAFVATDNLRTTQVVPELGDQPRPGTPANAGEEPHQESTAESTKIAGALAAASWLGDVNTVRLLSQIQRNARHRNFFGHPTHIAVMNGKREVAEYLLEHGGKALQMGSLDRSTLHWAAINGDERIVQLLLGLETLDPNSPDYTGHTPLAWAALKGHSDVVRQMLEGSTFPYLQGNWRYGRNTLSCAAEGGCEKTVELLLRVNERFVSSRDVTGRTALSYAAERGHVAIVAALLACKTEVTRQGAMTSPPHPLSYAAGSGHIEIVKMLLDADPGCITGCNFNRQSALKFAAEAGQDSIVKLLLASGSKCQGDYIWTHIDRFGRSPLGYAAENGHLSTVKLLSKRYSVLQEDNSGRTPLSYAASSGEDCVVKYILEYGGDPKSSDHSGRTPFSFACEQGNEETVKLLLDHDLSIVDMPDKDGESPLSYAAREGHFGIVKLLLAAGAPADTMDSRGRTPLGWASSLSRIPVVKHLLKRNDVNADLPDSKRRTPLSYAVQARNMEVVKLLVSSGKIDLNRHIGKLRTPLCYAASGCNLEMVKFLIEEGGADINGYDEKGHTALYYAYLRDDVPSRRRDQAMIDYLLARKAVESVATPQLRGRIRSIMRWPAGQGENGASRQK